VCSTPGRSYVSFVGQPLDQVEHTRLVHPTVVPRVSNINKHKQTTWKVWRYGYLAVVRFVVDGLDEQSYVVVRTTCSSDTYCASRSTSEWNWVENLYHAYTYIQADNKKAVDSLTTSNGCMYDNIIALNDCVRGWRAPFIISPP